MTPHPIIFRRLERRGDERFVLVEEVVRGESVSHTLRFDERTFAELERAFASHPFPAKAPTDDVVLFRSLKTPVGDSKKYFGLLIVNSGSRHHMKIEASEEAFDTMQAVFESWSARFKNA